MHLHTLGGLRLEGNAYRGRKPLLLLAYVRVEGARPRRELAQLFWSGARNPRDSLSVAIRQLRHAAGPVIDADRDWVRSAVSCDATDLLERIEAQRSLDAIGMYGGPFLDGLDLSLGEELEEWVYRTREVLASKVRDAHVDLAEMAVASDSFPAAGRHAEAALLLAGAAPPRPELLQHLARMLVAAGSAHADAARSESEEFGLGVPATKEAAREQLRAARAASASRIATAGAVVPHNLPEVATSFVGRDAELREIAAYVCAPDHRLITIHGPGGSGKTRLALEVARRRARTGEFSDGIYLTRLEDVPAGELVSAILATLGVEIGPDTAPLEALRASIGDRVMLLLLDNFEHLVAEGTVLAELLASCPNVRFLVTSRHRLDLVEEHLYPLGGLDTNASEAAFRLFVERARSTRMDFTVDDDGSPAIHEICRAVEGMPLAIELTATWVRFLHPREIVAELRQGLDILTGLAANLPERHESMRAVFDYSWALLPSSERGVARRLAVFQGGFDRNAAAQVAGASLLSLLSLGDKALLRRDGDRYSSHPLLHRYAREKLAEQAEERRGTELRHGEFFRSFLRASVGRPDEVARIDREIGNIFAAADMAAKRDEHDLLIEIMWLLAVEGRFYAARGHTVTSVRLLERAAIRARERGEKEKSHYLFGKLADAHKFTFGDLDAALTAYRNALELAEQTRDVHRLAVILSAIGITRFEQGADDAEHHLATAEELAREFAQGLALNHVLQHRAFLEGDRRNYEGARDLFVEALRVLEDIGDEPDIDRSQFEYQLFFTLLNLGEAELLLGDHAEALRLRQRAMEMARTHENSLWEAYALQELGETHHAMGDRERAHQLFRQALTLWQQHNIRVKRERLLAFMEAEDYQAS